MDNAGSAGSAIVFTKGSRKTDLCFTVFNQEFHINSDVLKMNCDFFETFLNPTGGILPSSTNPAFKSEWFTRLEDKIGNTNTFASWLLTSDHTHCKADLSKFVGGCHHEVKTFQNFLCAIFGRNYQLDNAAELTSLTDMARYYAALPTVSATVYAAVLRSPFFADSMLLNPCSVLLSAKTLRNVLLFKDSLVLSIGPWSAPQYKGMSDPDLVRIANSARANQGVISALAQHKRGKYGVAGIHDKDWTSPGEQMSEVAIACTKPARGIYQEVLSYKALMPAYYRGCLSIPFFPAKMGSEIQQILNPLLVNQLKLIPSAVAGVDKFKYYFLCLDITDDTLPWDRSEDEWYI
ncbi:uncharacterized protein PAC_05277 [Phialocephala subalpina]|uniref:BTB domain-containing protein n=1 Tax=Phialocephala subalpina TaxID=576137 RepID=A0A1L7WRJ5_9HELO|nr:uncharacterized protein PAC_05277 [Phialocephala subalpina]